MARPKLKIDEAELERLASAGALNSEIAAVFGVDDQTISRRFSRILAKKRAQRRIELRLAQTDAAKAGNATMLVWLGKQELGQSDEVVTVEKRAVEEDTLALREHLRQARTGSSPAVSNGVGSNGHGPISLP